VKGRRRKDTPHGEIPSNVRRGDYWKVLAHDGSRPLTSDEPGNLTGTVWMVAAPIGDRGFAIGLLTKHTVREHGDRTISVVPSDGSSNSILITGSHGQQFHGYIDNGVWRSV
jgi:chemotaxis methyl-accepting protein methylase